MPGERKTPGDNLTSRLFSRSEQQALQRRTMPGGGEVFSGALASRALDALGARAMTVDKSIIVSQDFDPSKPESQALYAHEQVHMMGSGGHGSHEAADAEELAARSVERMVLHRAMSGGYEGGYQPGAGAGMPSPHGPSDGGGRGVTPDAHNEADATPNGQAHRPTPEGGYANLRNQGFSHDDVVDKLAKEYLESQEEQSISESGRENDKKGAW